MSERVLRKGTKILFGAPASPMPSIWVNAIGQTVAQVPEIVEAYLPQCFLEGDTEARQVLVVGVQHDADIPAVMASLMAKMKLLLAEARFIDILPFVHGSVPAEARFVPCFVRQRRNAWWRFWW